MKSAREKWKARYDGGDTREKRCYFSSLLWIIFFFSFSSLLGIYMNLSHVCSAHTFYLRLILVYNFNFHFLSPLFILQIINFFHINLKRTKLMTTILFHMINNFHFYKNFLFHIPLWNLFSLCKWFFLHLIFHVQQQQQ